MVKNRGLGEYINSTSTKINDLCKRYELCTTYLRGKTNNTKLENYTTAIRHNFTKKRHVKKTVDFNKFNWTKV